MRKKKEIEKRYIYWNKFDLPWKTKQDYQSNFVPEQEIERKRKKKV